MIKSLNANHINAKGLNATYLQYENFLREKVQSKGPISHRLKHVSFSYQIVYLSFNAMLVIDKFLKYDLRRREIGPKCIL